MLIQLFTSMPGNEKGIFPTTANFLEIQERKLFYYANGKWQIQVLVNLTQVILHSRNEYLILEVCHSNFKLKNNKKEIFWDCLGFRGLIEFSDLKNIDPTTYEFRLKWILIQCR